MEVVIEWLIIFLLFLATTFAVSTFVNFMNRDDKRLQWKNVIIVAVSVSVIFCGVALILVIFRTYVLKINPTIRAFGLSDVLYLLRVQQDQFMCFKEEAN